MLKKIEKDRNIRSIIIWGNKAHFTGRIAENTAEIRLGTIIVWSDGEGF